MSSELISNLANVSLAVSVIVAVIFGMTQVGMASRDRRERVTLEALRSFQSREFAELINYITTHDMPQTRDEMIKLPSEEQVMLIQLSQQMESLGMLVYERLINIDLVDKTLGSFVVTCWEQYKPMFTAIREQENNPDPFLGEYFQWLAERIEERMRENPRKPFYTSKRWIYDPQRKTKFHAKK